MVENSHSGMNQVGQFASDSRFICKLFSPHAYSCPLTRNRDPEGQPELSAEQRKESPVWRRPALLQSRASRSERRAILPQEILQHIVTDCSVCASISVCLEHAQRFGSSVSSFKTFSHLALNQFP